MRTRFNIRHYEAGDLEKITFRACDRMQIERQESMAQTGDVYTIVGNNDTILAVVGINRCWGLVGSAWAVVSDSMRGNGRRFAKAGRELLDHVVKMRGYRRLNIFVQASATENYRWARLMGFKDEYRMEEGAPDGGAMLGMVRWNDVK